MKREILFKAKRKDNGQWVEGCYQRLVVHGVMKYFILPCNGLMFDDVKLKDVLVEVLEETVSQFTGLIAKNGKEIFEGDMIRQLNFNGEQYTATYEVVFDEGSFCLKLHKGNEKAMKNDCLSAFSFDLYQGDYGRLRKGEIIGNKYDNPELLTSK